VTLPGWLTSARETVDAAISAESSRQWREVALEARSELEERLGELIALEVAVKVGRDGDWFDCVWDSRGAGLAVEALVSKGPQRAAVNRLQTSLPAFVADAKRTVTDAWIARIHDQVGRADDLSAGPNPGPRGTAGNADGSFAADQEVDGILADVNF